MCSALQGKQSSPAVMDLKATNKLLSAAQRTSKSGIRFVKGEFNFDEAILLSVTDAPHAAELLVDENGNKQGHKSPEEDFSCWPTICRNWTMRHAGLGISDESAGRHYRSKRYRQCTAQTAQGLGHKVLGLEGGSG